MEIILQWLDDVDDWLVRLPLALQSSHTQRVLSILLMLALAGLAVWMATKL